MSYSPPSSPRRTRSRRLGPASFLSLFVSFSLSLSSLFLSVVLSPAVHPTPPYRPRAPSCNRGCPFGAVDPLSLFATAAPPRFNLASTSLQRRSSLLSFAVSSSTTARTLHSAAGAPFTSSVVSHHEYPAKETPWSTFFVSLISPYTISRNVLYKRHPDTTSDKRSEKDEECAGKCAEKRVRGKRREKQRGK